MAKPIPERELKAIEAVVSAHPFDLDETGLYSVSVKSEDL